MNDKYKKFEKTEKRFSIAFLILIGTCFITLISTFVVNEYLGKESAAFLILSRICIFSALSALLIGFINANRVRFCPICNVRMEKYEVGFRLAFKCNKCGYEYVSHVDTSPGG